MNKDYIMSLAEKDVRIDGRKFDEYREVSIETGVSMNAEGSARCKIGDTEVIVGIKMAIGTPYPDAADEGSIVVGAELLPMSNPDFESGPPGKQAIELARIIDRGVRESKAIDFKKLCIKEGEKCWMVFIDIYSINDDGNLIDAAGLATLTALNGAKFHKLDKDDNINYKEYGDKKVELELMPITCTFGKVNGKIIIDPNNDEESALDARLSIATFNGKVYAMQKGLDRGFTLEEIEYMIDVAIAKEKELKTLIKEQK
ncbi:RNA-binding protein [archaeon]|nr:RNA-binding protein [archaeon]